MKPILSMSLHKELEEKLSRDNVCYVLITCEVEKKDGSMNVEMSYGGNDPTLASYLLDGAQAYMEEEMEDTI